MSRFFMFIIMLFFWSFTKLSGTCHNTIFINDNNNDKLSTTLKLNYNFLTKIGQVLVKNSKNMSIEIFKDEEENVKKISEIPGVCQVCSLFNLISYFVILSIYLKSVKLIIYITFLCIRQGKKWTQNLQLKQEQPPKKVRTNIFKKLANFSKKKENSESESIKNIPLPVETVKNKGNQKAFVLIEKKENEKRKTQNDSSDSKTPKANPCPSSEKIIKKPPGFINDRLNCYANSLIQCIFNLPNIEEAIGGNKLLKELYQSYTTKKGPLSNRAFRKSIDKKRYDGKSTQDPLEFLDDVFLKCPQLELPFNIITRTHFSCECGHQVYNDIENQKGLQVNYNEGEMMDVEEATNRSTQEIMSERKCSECGRYMKEKMDILSSPMYLIVRTNIFNYRNQTKNRIHLKTLETLNLNASKKESYKFVGSIFHNGHYNPDSFYHYTSLIKTNERGSYIYADDKRVDITKEIPLGYYLDDIIGSTYVMFFSKI